MGSVAASCSYEGEVPTSFVLVVVKVTQLAVQGAVGSRFGARLCLVSLVTGWTCRVCQGMEGRFPEAVCVGLSRVKQCEKEGRAVGEVKISAPWADSLERSLERELDGG